MWRARLLREHPTRVARRRAGCAALLVLLVPTGCSGGPGEPAAEAVLARPAAEPSAEPTAPAAAEQVQEAGHGTAPGAGPVLRSRVTRVAGHLSDVRRERVATQARAVVEDYLAGAFAGEGGALRGFTRELRRAAGSDRELLTGAAGVEVRSARAWFSVAAPAGRPVGLTARLDVRLTDGDRTGSMTGRLLMTRLTTPAGGEWRVFGYDLARSPGAGAKR